MPDIVSEERGKWTEHVSHISKNVGKKKQFLSIFKKKQQNHKKFFFCFKKRQLAKSQNVFFIMLSRTKHSFTCFFHARPLDHETLERVPQSHLHFSLFQSKIHIPSVCHVSYCSEQHALEGRKKHEDGRSLNKQGLVTYGTNSRLLQICNLQLQCICMECGLWPR